VSLASAASVCRCWIGEIITAYPNRKTHVILTSMPPKKLRAVRIKERDLKELAKLAKREDETVSSLIQQAIREFLNRKTK